MREKINGIEIFTFEEGKGKPVILVHGLTVDHHNMLSVQKWLKYDHRVISYDCRGHGQSDKPTEYTLLDHAHDLLSLMDFYGFEKASVIGGSMGSYITMQAAILAPERFEKIVLLVPKAHGQSSSTEIIKQSLSKNGKEPSNLKFKLAMMNATFAPAPFSVRMKAIKKYLNYQKGTVKLTPEETAAVNKALYNFDLRPELHKVICPTLICSGKYDRINPPEFGHEVASLIPNSRFELFENSGHVLNLEEEEKCASVVRAFLDE